VLSNFIEVYKRVYELRADGSSRDEIYTKARQGGWGNQEDVKLAFGMIHRDLKPAAFDRNETLDDLDRDIEMQALKAEVTSYKRREKRLMGQADRANRLVEIFQANPVKIEPIPYRPVRVEGHRQVMVALSSDEHIQSRMTFERGHGINEYNVDLARQRMIYFAQRQIDYVQRYWREKNITALVDANLGDKFEGSIHDSDVTNEVEIAAAYKMWLKTKAECYQMILKACPHLRIISLHVSGNHPRRTDKQDVDRPQNNDDCIAAEALRFAFELAGIEQVEFVIPDSYFAIRNINGHLFLFEHSQFVRSWGGIPFYGLARRYGEYIQTLERTAEYQAAVVEAMRKPILAKGDDLILDDIPYIQKHYCGANFHTACKGIETAAGSIMLNGSLVGPNDFSLSLPRANQASQILFAVHPEFGPTDVTSIQLGHIRYPRQLKPAEVLDEITVMA